MDKRFSQKNNTHANMLSSLKLGCSTIISSDSTKPWQFSHRQESGQFDVFDMDRVRRDIKCKWVQFIPIFEHGEHVAYILCDENGMENSPKNELASRLLGEFTYGALYGIVLVVPKEYVDLTY